MLPRGASAGSAARWLTVLVPAALLIAVYVGEYGFDLYPCEMCWWQRYGHFAALALGLIAVSAKGKWRVMTALAALAILASGLIGGFHAGVEYGWWSGFTECTTTSLDAGGDPLKAILAAPIVRCDQVQWELFGISLAGYNFIVSVAVALIVLVLMGRSRRANA